MSSTDRFKFRVYDNDAGEYIDDGALLDGRTGRISGNGIYTIEQCTGLRDKNGTLIYEGDVVVVPNQYPFYDYAKGVQHKNLNSTRGEIEHDAELNYIGIIEWEEEAATFVMVLQCVNPRKRGISSGMAEQLDEYEALEVIGNIHETEAKND